LAIHEFGHVITIPLPELVTMVMGSGMQILLPLFLAGVFAFRERDPLGAALCLGWSATCMQDASVYIADASSQQLQLIGGLHDWAYTLDRLGAMHHAAGLARLVWTFGLLSLICAFTACGWGLVARPRRPQRMIGRAGSDSATALAARPAESAELGAFTSPATGSPERLSAGAGPDAGYFAGGGPPRSG
ncbi:MAG TPA: hypothetical protein VML96_03205, partial [Egibacteraceae bacterium]|nr:hypothetical protein [Egibacteraceae bacterium]